MSAGATVCPRTKAAVNSLSLHTAMKQQSAEFSLSRCFGTDSFSGELVIFIKRHAFVHPHTALKQDSSLKSLISVLCSTKFVQVEVEEASYAELAYSCKVF